MTAELLEELVASRAPQLMTLTVDQFHEMIKSGIVPDGSPIELIDGLLVRKDRGTGGANGMGHDPRHALIVTRLLYLLAGWAQSIGGHIRVQLPVTLTDFSEPEPDLALVLGPLEACTSSHPTPDNLAAVIEVADSSLRYDRTTKQRLYASAGIPTFWIVNLADGKVEVHLRPNLANGSYSEKVDYAPGQSIPLTVGEHVLNVDVAALLA